MNFFKTNTVDKTYGLFSRDYVEMINLENFDNVPIFFVIDAFLHLTDGQSFLVCICKISSYNCDYIFSIFLLWKHLNFRLYIRSSLSWHIALTEMGVFRVVWDEHRWRSVDFQVL